ncbi:MAG: ribosome-associated translation inhibitor RaiA [Acidimicrobiia bacterium]
MDVQVRGRRMDIPQDLKEMATEKLEKIERFVHDVRRIDVDFREIASKRITQHYRCEVLVHVKHHLLKAHASAADPHAALDLVVDKIEHQAARLKERRVARSHPRRHHPNERKYLEAVREDSHDVALNAEHEAAELVKTKKFALEEMTTEAAGLQMQLLAHDFYFFRNATSGVPAVVYRRKDGHLGVIESDE